MALLGASTYTRRFHACTGFELVRLSCVEQIRGCGWKCIDIVAEVPVALQRLNLRFNLLKTKRRLHYLKTQTVPRCKHFSSRL